MVVQWVALSPHCKKVLGLNLSLGLSVWACSPLVLMLWFPLSG
uniref:Uncharacterized protein n=1 Tax=Anguilla anguilla TaxID=7936 RepID=A0A0E9VGV9_ANGAN